jgi:hypothetical protein
MQVVMTVEVGLVVEPEDGCGVKNLFAVLHKERLSQDSGFI